MTKETNIYEVLSQMQKTLKAPKNQYNNFGKYKYRSCEDILEGIKAVMPEGYSITIEDEIVNIGDRYYVKATAKLCAYGNYEKNTAYAREDLSKKGMDASQVTGAASSYARKYALNGLFAIDDTKDADTGEHKETQDNAPKEAPKAAPKKSWEQIRANEIAAAIKKHTNLEALEKMWIANDADLSKISDASEKAYAALHEAYKAKIKDLDYIPV